ncbi:DUF697 domain-containing protein [Rhodocytophaga aerolata]|uniref:DUF697 domain-containing protein n=1 Tax=Rhodocytophaga aerolata TaxID=455078 RepID=A0ABT8R979_9BACT|nr:DUF697 domain-containing protein [Rhodocytophaga aerolata]MDO1448649.1 DUF697 domain-containing protein [Rhodocytophaga aerolata]
MRHQLKFLFITISVLVLTAFVLFVFNQLMQVYTYTSAFNPLLGKAVLASLTLLFLALFILPVLLYLRLPKPITPPANEAEKPLYLEKLGKRLSKNPLLREGNFDFSKEADIQRALDLLSIKADTVIQNTAKSVFLTTSISQNGKLDALTVFITQSKMIWDLAHIYYQRPAPKDIVALYANVGATTFLAAQIEDLDFSEQLEPVFGTILQNSALKSVPFVSSITNVIMDSLLEGTINAFLTLRVGVVTKRYCGTTETFQMRQARRAAFKEASVMLKSIVMQSSGQVVSSIVKATRKAGSNTVKTGMIAANRATSNVRSGLATLASRIRGVAE